MAMWLAALTAVAAMVAMVGAPAGAVGELPVGVLGSGSDTTFNMMLSLDLLYNGSAGCNLIAVPQPLDNSCQADVPGVTITTENYRHDRISEVAPLGSGNGIKQLCGLGTNPAHTDFARSSRAPGTSDCSGLRFVAYARDALSWECFPGVTGSGCASMSTKNLTQQQLKDIFVNCTITNWSQVGGANVPIHVYTAQAGSGTRTTWDGFMGGSSDLCVTDPTTHIILENHNDPIIANGDAANAIFFFSSSDYSVRVKGKDGSTLGAVDGIFPTAQTIQDGSFPFGRFVFNVLCSSSCTAGASPQAAVNYADTHGWICKAKNAHSLDPLTGVNYRTEIQKQIQSNGFVPINFGPTGGGEVGNSFCRLTLH
jgi:ABC-type phosphate transport system substrate-binding protein